jgi:hypothetical protein
MTDRMRVLVACEFSGRVRDAFISKGHDAVSCDILDTEVPGPHHKGDVRDLLSEDWDLIVAHPPCTYLALSGVQWLKKSDERWKQMLDAVDFFNLFLSHPCPKVCIENPIMHNYAKQRLLVPNYSQKTQPFFHGHPERKATCFWLKGLPLLRASSNVSHLMIGKAASSTDKVHWEAPGPDRQKNRSRTLQGIANAMADQWG